MTFGQCSVGHVGHVGPAELSFGAFFWCFGSASQKLVDHQREKVSVRAAWVISCRRVTMCGRLWFSADIESCIANVTHVRINFEKDSCQNEKVFATCSCPHVGASFLAEDFCSGPLGSGESSDSHHGYGGYGIMDIANITRELCCSAQHERLHVLVHLQCCSSPTCSSFRFFPAMTRAQDNLRVGSYPVPPEACLKREESQKQKSPHITQDHSNTSFKINLTSLLKNLNFARRTFGGKTDLRRSF